MDAGGLLRDARARHGLSQERLARRARTTARQVGRIERGEISPSVGTLERLLAAVGERLELVAAAGPGDNRSIEELRADYRDLTPSERIARGAALSRTGTAIAAAAQKR